MMSAHVVSTGRASDSVTYAYDKAGNPTSRKELELTTAYTFNNLHQFASGSWTGKLTVIGEVNYAAGTVTVNGVTGRIFPDRVFEATNITVSAGTNILTAVYRGPAFTNTQMVATDRVTVVVGNAAYTHDGNGNLTGDQNFTYQYDLANRLTNVISKASGSSVLAARYDGLGRRVEVTRNGSTVERYVYFPGSFLVLAVLDGSNAVKEIYTHGPDLSGTVGDAGGIGGILSVTTNITQSTARKYLHADAMGNVVFVSDPEGRQVASYGFTPFGKLVNQVGDYTARFLFSSKELDPETGLVLYGHRYLKPSSGTWLTRDLIAEAGGVGLYGFVENNSFTWIDAYGLTPCCFRGKLIDVDCHHLGTTIDRQKRNIRSAIFALGDVNDTFRCAELSARVSLGISGAFAVSAVSGLTKGLLANATKTTPAISQAGHGMLSVGVFTKSGKIAIAGSTAYSATIAEATAARNVGALALGAQAAGSELGQEGVERASKVAQRILDPYGRLSDVQMEMGVEMSHFTHETIKTLQERFRLLMEMKQTCCD